MKKQFKRFMSLLLALLITLSASTPSLFAEQHAFDGTQHDWAQAELDQAYSLDLTYDQILTNFTSQITREEFSTLAVLLYQKLTGKLAEFTKNPFSDTTNPNVLKAYNLGIVKGMSATTFMPKNKITRQELCTMLMRTLSASGQQLSFDGSASFPFTDEAKIEPWAKTNMKMAYQFGIIKGFSATTIGPKDLTTREQAILMVKRTYEKINGVLPVIVDNTPTLPAITTTVPAVNVSELALTYNGKIIDVTTIQVPPQDTNSNNYIATQGRNLLDPIYNELVSLFVSTTEVKPTTLPLAQSGYHTVMAANAIQTIQKDSPLYLGGWPTVYGNDKPDSVYTNQDGGSFINTQGNMLRWFAYQVKNIAIPEKIVWQVASAPFNGGVESWKAPVGLIASGEVSGNSGGFQIDFKSVYAQYTSQFPLNYYFPEQTYFYVRAVAANGSGAIYGDPGHGIAVTIGKALPSYTSQKGPVRTTLDLYTPDTATGIFYGEFKDLPKLQTKGVFQEATNAINYRVFTFNALPKNVTEILIQVSDRPFDPNTSQWPNDGGTLYENQALLPTHTWALVDANALKDTSYPGSIAVPFSAFAPRRSDIQDGDYTTYYVRGIALTPDIAPGTFIPSYTDTIEVTYGYSDKILYWFNPPMDNVIKVDAVHPTVDIVGYMPPKAAQKEMYNHYVVFNTPINVNDVTSPLITDRGMILPFYSNRLYYTQQGILTEYDYITKVISIVLAPGAKLYFPPPVEKDKPWYDEIIDGVVGFFSDVFNIAKTITNQVTSAYNSIKTQLVTFCVNLCPIDALKGPFKLALEAAINSGMIACGLPPTLPNFDELLQGNIDYLARAALSEAGLPSSALTDELIDKVANELYSELTQAAKVASPNPLNLKFLKLDPEYCYQPGYIDLKISNTSSKYVTVPGHLNLDITFEITPNNKEDLSITTEVQPGSTASAPGSATNLEEYAKYMKHFTGELNNNSVTSTGTIIYEAFKPIKGYSIPTLLPLETQSLRLYLTDELSGTRYNVPQSKFTWQDGYNVFFNNGNGQHHFTFFNMSCNYSPAANYYYVQTGSYADTGNYDYWYQDTQLDINYKKINQDVQMRLDKPINTPWAK